MNTVFYLNNSHAPCMYVDNVMRIRSEKRKLKFNVMMTILSGEKKVRIRRRRVSWLRVKIKVKVGNGWEVLHT